MIVRQLKLGNLDKTWWWQLCKFYFGRRLQPFAFISLGQNWNLIYLVNGSELHADSQCKINTFFNENICIKFYVFLIMIVDGILPPKIFHFVNCFIAYVMRIFRSTNPAHLKERTTIFIFVIDTWNSLTYTASYLNSISYQTKRLKTFHRADVSQNFIMYGSKHRCKWSSGLFMKGGFYEKKNGWKD